MLYLVEEHKLLFVAKTFHVPCLIWKLWKMRCLCMKEERWEKDIFAENYAHVSMLSPLHTLAHMGAKRLHVVCRRSLPWEVNTWLRALTWHEIDFGRLWWSFVKNAYSIIILVKWVYCGLNSSCFGLCSWGEIFDKNPQFAHGFVNWIYVFTFLMAMPVWHDELSCLPLL